MSKRTYSRKGVLILCGIMFMMAAAVALISERDDTASVPVVSEKVLVPGGQSVGVKMDVKGVLVVGLEEIEDEEGNRINPGLLSGLQIGDMILQVNGKSVFRAEEVQEIVNSAVGTISLKIKRNDRIFNVDIEPVKSSEDDLMKLGIWVKDKTAGIGTLTYYDPANTSFGALGHGIVDPETNSILSVETGCLFMSQVQEVREGKDGEPGEIRGIFYHQNEPLGSLVRNCRFGVFGTSYHPLENPIYTKPLAVGTRDQVELGKAYILSTLEDNEIRRFEIEIEKINSQNKPDDKSMVIRVTDRQLIEECGGIVQGMSGSPIIQNDRIIGAVTHVFLNDPRRGYGIFVEWMLEESDDVEK
ncbi:MAG: SpoIVB peptidase [Anaerovoracaceae bacterium]|nr:SpoIVB peptidase [Anaerovoracaceae bacterium]